MNTSDTAVALDNLNDGEILTGAVLRPFIDQDKLRGAILSFPGKKETALLHVKQIQGGAPEARLSQLRLGDEVEVKIMIHGPAHARKIWASETALVGERSLVDELSSAAEAKTVFAGRVINVSKFGVFVDMLEGPAKGQRGLIHNSNLYQKGAGLAQICHSLTPNSDVSLQVLGAKVDAAGTLRIDLVLAEQSA
ncbi:MAG: S1 RNA-binding domain-containing protein [Candidatus Obscuribacterales bacterium]|nr:S1 RNA-binding domain-containing protein [Candidatus Obscuribacterales bacterium]